MDCENKSRHGQHDDCFKRFIQLIHLSLLYLLKDIILIFEPLSSQKEIFHFVTLMRLPRFARNNNDFINNN